jgi:hypothetical protein
MKETLRVPLLMTVGPLCELAEEFRKSLPAPVFSRVPEPEMAYP